MFLQRRNRILRQSPAIRAMVAETILKPADFIAPLFIDEGQNISFEIPSMPGYYRRSIDLTVKEVKELWQLGIRCVLLFIKCEDALKDNTGKEAWNKNGLMQRSIKAIKQAVPEMVVMTDVALDPYSSYGHDGIVKDGEIVNDATVEGIGENECESCSSRRRFCCAQRYDGWPYRRYPKWIGRRWFYKNRHHELQRQICFLFLWALPRCTRQCAGLW
jgi:delta-aminolevulinic acid dehydratase/porphobilinogen synthase